MFPLPLLCSVYRGRPNMMNGSAMSIVILLLKMVMSLVINATLGVILYFVAPVEINLERNSKKQNKYKCVEIT